MNKNTHFGVQQILFVVALFQALSIIVSQADTPPGGVNVFLNYGQTPLRFEQNVGQADPRAQFISRGNGYAMYFLPTEITLALDVTSNAIPVQHQLMSPVRHPQKRSMGLVHLKWEGANTQVNMSPEETLPEKINYMIGNDQSRWHTDLSAYGKVHYQNLYPGVDLVFYGNQTQLEYDFVVAPHADPRAIALNIEGADQIKVESNGDLAFSVQGRVTRFCHLMAYQTVNGVRRNISSRYNLKGNRIRFDLGNYDHKLPLIIDPVLSYSTFLGGLGVGLATGVAVDAAGNAYVSGYTTSTLTNLVTPGALQSTNRGGQFGSQGYYASDCFVAKLDKTGTNVVYFTFLGSSGMDITAGMAVDIYGNAYVCGYTIGNDFPVTANALTPTNGAYKTAVIQGLEFDGLMEGFVSKLNTNGTQLLYSTYVGHTGGSYPVAVMVDPQCNIYLGGEAYYDFPTTNAIQATNDLNPGGYGGDQYNDFYDAFVSEISSNGQSLVFSTYLGGTKEDYVEALALDGQNNLYAAGASRSSDFPVRNAMQTNFGGGTYNAIAFKIDQTRTNLVYSTYLGGNVIDYGRGIAVDTNGNAYVVGITFSANFPITNAFDGLINTNGSTAFSDGFITKLSPSGQPLFSTYIGGSQSDTVQGVAVQSDGELVLVGQTGSTDFAPYANYGSVNSGRLDGFVAKFNSAGTVLMNFAYLGGSNMDNAYAVALDSQNNAYVVGSTASPNYPITGTNVAVSNFGATPGTNGFLTKLYFEPNQLGTTVTTTWQPTNGWTAIGPAASLVASNTWSAASQIVSVSSNGVTSLANTRLQRGVSYDPTFTSFIIPLNQQTGFRLDDLGVNAEYFGGSRPWFTRLQNDIRTQISLVASTNGSGVTSNYYGYVTNFSNPIAAFGANAGGAPLYVNEQFKFGVYAGAQYESTNGVGTNFAAPLRILVYNLSSFVAGQTNLVAPIATNYITIPRRTIAADAANWQQFSTNGFSLTVAANGLNTTVQLATESGGAWGVVPQFTNAQSGTFVITHECTTNLGYGYVLEGIGVVPLSTNLYPMVTNSAGTVGWNRLYSMDFATRPPWRSVFIDQPQFDGTPMPSFYQDASLSELTNLDAVVTNSISLTNSAYLTVDDSPELRRHPTLDALVASLNNDPVAIANYVVNQTELTDALAYNENNGQASASAVNESGVNRSALDVYLEGQGSPVEQCALLVYMLRQAGYPAAYVFPTNNNVQMVDTRLSALLRMQLHGAVNQYGQTYTTNTLITVNYPWVVTTISNQTVHIFPWLKDTDIAEGLNLYDYMPTNYDNGFKWLSHYLYGDTNILGLSAESDAPSTLFPRFVKQQLLQTAPGIALDDIGLSAFNRQHYYTRWQDFPTPSVVTNPTQVAWADSLTSITNVLPGMTNIFNTVSLTIASQNNTNTTMTIGPLRMADLHNREMFMATNGANGLMLWLAPYIPGNTIQSAFNSADPALTNKQVAVLALATNDVNFVIRLTHNRHQAINFSPASQYLGVTETLQFSTPNRPFNLPDITAICFNVGRVTPAMIDVHAQAFQQMAYQWSLNTNTLPAVADYQAAAAYMMGMDYYSHVSQFLPVCEQLHKAQVVSWYAEGLSRLTPVQLGAQNFMRPSMDMFYSEMAHAGNGTSHPDSGNDSLAATDDFDAIMQGEIAAQEHSIINGYYQSQNSVSAVVLLRLAQQRSTNGITGILELNRNNYLAIGATNGTGYGATKLQYYDATIWSAVTNAFSGWDADYVRAYITPGPVSLQAASYRGMGLVIVGKSQSASIISVNMNGVMGATSLYFGDTPAAISTAYAGSSPNDSFSASSSLDASAGYGGYYNGGDLYYGGSASGSSGFDYYWTTPAWFGSSSAFWPYVMPVNRYQISATFTPPSQINLSQQINDLYYFSSSTPAQTSLTHALDSGNTGFSVWNSIKKFVMDPVDVMSGEFYHSAVDLTLAGPQPLQLRRNYSSQNQDDRNGFGYGWDINVVPYLGIATNTTTNIIITAVELDGSVIAYRQQTNNLNLYLPTLTDNLQMDNNGNGGIGSINNPFNAKLVHSFSGTNELYTLTAANGEIRRYIVNSFPVNTATNIIYRQRPYLATWQDTQSNAWTFTYGTNSTTPSYGSVTRIQCNNGNYLGLDYNAGGYVIDAYTSDDERTTYQYDDFGDLVLVVRPDATEETYEYQHTEYTTNGTTYVDSTHLLIRQFKPDGRTLQNVYDNQRRVVNQLATVGPDLNLYTNATFVYSNNFTLSKMTNGINGYTLVKDVNGHTNRYDYANSLVTTNTDALGQQIIQNWYADNAASPGYSRSLYQTRDKRGLWTQFQYNNNGDVTNSFSWGDLTGDGTTKYATNTATYDTNNLPLVITDPVGNSVQAVYSAQYPYLPQFIIYAAGGTPTITNQFTYGNVTNVVVNGSITITNMSFGLLQQQVRAVNSPDAATIQWSFDGRGYVTQQTQFTGTGDPAVINYFTCNNQGEIIERTDAAGQRTDFGYDDMRRPIAHEVFAANQSLPMFWEYAYYNENGEINWYDGAHYNPEDYQWFDYDGAGRPTTQIRWRSEAKADGSGMEAPAGYNLYAQTFNQFDKFGNLTLTVDPRGAMTTNQWDAIGQLVQRTHLDTNGTTVLSSEEFVYEPGGQVKFYTNALGGVTTNLYTATGLPESRRNPDGSTIAWLYNLDGRIRRVIQSNGAYWQTTYDDVDRITTNIFYSAGGASEATNLIQLDRRGNVIQRTDEAGNVFATTFDDLDRVKVTAGPSVATITSSSGFTPGGPTTYTTNFLRQVVTNYFDAAGQVLTSANVLGEESVTSFDALGRVTQAQLFSATGTLIRQSSLAYSSDYNSVTITSGSGAGAIVNTVYTDHDGNNVLSVGYPSTGVNEFMLNQFDLAGNLITQQHNSIAGGILTNWTTASFAYDGLNRVVGKLDRDGAPTAFAYDSMGDLTNQTLPGGVHWQAAFTNSGQMLKDWNVNGSSVTRSNNYAYFASGSPFAGLLQSKIDGRNTTNIFAYDDWLRVTNVTSTGILPEQKITTGWQYEPRGFVTAISEQFASTNTGPNTSITRSFDGYGQLSTETINGGTFGYSTSQGWDAAGRRNSLNFGNVGYAFGWQADGALTGVTNLYGIGSYSYTTSGLLASRMVGNRQTVIGSWDGEGRPLSITTSVNGTAKLIESLGWSADGLLNTHTLTEVGNFTDSRSYAYANLSRRVTQEQLNLTSSTAWTNTFVYDKGVAGGPGVLTSAGQAGQSSGLWNGGADAFSRVSAETNSTFAYSAYGHVNGQSTLSAWLDNQPLSITGLGTNAMQWRSPMELSPGTHQIKVAALHPSGFYTAWTTNSFTNNIAYQSTADSFDGSGNITNRVWRNASGTTNRIQTLSWDARGRLHQVVDRDATNNGYIWTAVYDSLNRRLSTTTVLVTNGVVYPAASQTLSSYFDPLYEFQELGVSVGSQTTWKLMGPDANGQYGGLNGVGGFEGTSPYLYTFNPTISDARGNILAEVTNGAVSWNPSRPTGYGAVPGYRPAAFGSGADLAQSSALRGREVDITGYYHWGKRDYDPVNGQWLSYDPAWNSGDPNGFSYAGGDPLNYIDPDGRTGKSFLENDKAGNDRYSHAIHTGLAEGLTTAWFSMAQASTRATLQEMYLSDLAPVTDFFFRDAHETVSAVFDAHTSGFDRTQGKLYAWSGFAGEIAPSLLPWGGAEVGVARLSSFAADRAPGLSEDIASSFAQFSASKQLGTVDLLPKYDLTTPWYKYVAPRYDVVAAVRTGGRTVAQTTATKIHEGQHIMDVFAHPQITYLAARKSYFPGAGFARYWMEYRAYNVGGRISGVGDLGVPLGSFKPNQLNYFYNDLTLTAIFGIGAGADTYYLNSN